MKKTNYLYELERQAQECGLLLRIKINRPLNLWALRLVVASCINPNKIIILGEMKAWAYSRKHGFQLDTMRVSQSAPSGVGHLIWAATMAWALEETPCKKARLLAIRDEEDQHKKLVRYFQMRGFEFIREVGSDPLDLHLRMIWGGSGMLMNADCELVLQKSYSLWNSSSFKRNK